MSRSFLDGFSDHVAERPQATALVWHGERISYSELYERAARVSAALRAMHLPRSQPVAIVAEKSPTAIGLMLGCLMAELCFVLPSVQLPGAIRRMLLESARCSAILRQEAGTNDGSESFSIDLVQPSANEAGTSSLLNFDEIAVILTTSGSTGVPKLVPLPIPAIERFTDWACNRFDFGPDKTVLNYAPLNFDLCFLEIWATLKAGGRVALVDPRYGANGEQLLGILSTTDAQIIQAVPMLYRLLIDAAAREGHRFESAQHVIFTGDTMPSASLDALPRLFPAAKFYNVYGCTETNDSFMHELDLSRPLTGPIPIGEPLPGVHYLILDEEDKPLRGSGIGELLVSTPFQTGGYLDGRLNRGKFVTYASMGPTQTYFRSGDLVRCRHDGSITLEGRKDFNVKVRGIRVNIQEVEQIILKHAEVVEGAVLALPDSTAGYRLHAAIRRRQESDLNSLRLFQHCAGKLARAAIPSTFAIGDMALPRTPTGKIDRQQLQQFCLRG